MIAYASRTVTAPDFAAIRALQPTAAVCAGDAGRQSVLFLTLTHTGRSNNQ